MVAENKISVSIPAETASEIQVAIKVINDKLAVHLLALTPDERRAIPKMGDGTIPFVKKAFEYATANKEFTPAFVDVEEMKKDIEAVETLQAFLRPLQQLVSSLDDTIMLSGSEAYVSALSYYNSVKNAARLNAPAAKVIAADLKQRFIAKSAKPEVTASKN